jgi:hypothetical protein
MKQQLIDRIHAEHEEWLAELKQKPVDEIIRSAYEICYREEFISILEADYLTPKEIAKLLRLPNPVGFLYGEWLKNDASVVSMLEDVVTDYLYEQTNNAPDPCDNCNKPCCYGCPYAEEEEENENA